MSQQWQRIVFLSMCTLLLIGKSANGDPQNCTVGDLTQGHWYKLPIQPSECYSPGPPAADSDWPHEYNLSGSVGWSSFAYRIGGIYKIEVGLPYGLRSIYVAEEDWSGPPEPMKTCIDGLKGADAKLICDYKRTEYEQFVNRNPETMSYYATYTFASDYCIEHLHFYDPDNAWLNRYNLYSRSEKLLSTYRWFCGSPTIPIDNEKNLGSPQCE